MEQSQSFEQGTLSRRGFVKLAGTGLTFSIVLGGTAATVLGQDESVHIKEASIGAWVRIDSDGGIVIYNPAAEMGQGSMTALPVILAEELDADWSKVRIEHSPVEPGVYGRSWRRGGAPSTMMTVGSVAISGYFDRLRTAGAQIRRVLMENVAREWDVPLEELSTEPSTVVHAASGKRISFGEIVAFAEIPEQMPDIDASELKAPQDFRLIGTSVPRHDVPAKSDGSALYAIDVEVPGMLYGMISRSPVHNDSPVSFNKEEILSMPGVVSTVTLDYGVGVIGESFMAVKKAKDALKITWAGGASATVFNSEESLAGYAEIPGSGAVQPRVISESGNYAGAISQSVKQYEADYFADHVYHAQMEPLNAVVSVNEAGDAAEAWVGSQSMDGARRAIAETLGINMERVTLHPCYLGGGFGRRSNSDYVIEAVHLSNAVKKPVKLVWTREDDLQYGQYRPMCLQRMAAGVDEEGTITAWNHCVVGDGGGLLSSGINIPFYDIPNQNIELCGVSHGMRLKHWRAVGHGFNKYAIEAFLDEIAADQSIDPYELRRKLLRNSPRALKVLDIAAEMSNWSSTVPEGRARGIAFGERSGSLAAGVAEISVNASTGKINVHQFWCAVDGGIIVQPDNAIAQLEGGIIHGLSSVLYERITVKDGMAQQSNFHDYPIMRMADIPDVHIKLIKSYERPTGMGETSLPVTGGAVANAFASLTGKRLRHMPFTPDRVREVLG